MLRIGLPTQFSQALHMRAPALQLCRAVCQPTAAPRCVHTVSLLDYKPSGLANLSSATRRQACPVAAAFGPAARQFSTAPFPPPFSSVGSPETTTYLRNQRNGAEIYVVGERLQAALGSARTLCHEAAHKKRQDSSCCPFHKRPFAAAPCRNGACVEGLCG